MKTTKTDAQTVLDALSLIESLQGEININNYSVDDICYLNNSFVEAVLCARESLPAAQRLVDGEKWQPINTAPKDGIHYLGMIVADRFYGEPFVCYYDEDEGHICLHQTEARLHRPTHWMHFPKPTTSEEV